MDAGPFDRAWEGPKVILDTPDHDGRTSTESTLPPRMQHPDPSHRNETSFPPSLTPMMSNVVITGGTFTQQVQHQQTIVKGGFEYLKDAAASAAFHNSAQRCDPPKCHPNTRVAVIQRIMDWILGLGTDTRDALIMWLNGAAGAGKSAIAQTVAERCFNEGLLLASFFFSRSDPTRNHGAALFPTLAYQIAVLLPQVRDLITAPIQSDPLIFSRSLYTQFKALILDPLKPLINSGFFSRPITPRLILIDGLDECADRKVQRQILDVLSKALVHNSIPLIFLVCSRPEHEISTAFGSRGLRSITAPLVLEHDIASEDDIRLFLNDRFEDIKETHPFKRHIPASWPSDAAVSQLIEKSSRQFIYASTVVKYISSIRHQPVHRLEIVLNLRPGRDKDLPFAELDALYTQVFSSVENVDEALNILSFDQLYKSDNYVSSVDSEHRLRSIEAVLGLSYEDTEVMFCDLSSIVVVVDNPYADHSHSLHILHASLFDFLLDPQRSGRFFLHQEKKTLEHVRASMRFLSGLDFNLSLDMKRFYTDIGHWTVHIALPAVIANTPACNILDDIRAFPWPVIAVGLKGLDTYDTVAFYFTLLQILDGRTGSDLYNHHLDQLDQLLRHTLEPYGEDPRFPLISALLRLNAKSYNRRIRPLDHIIIFRWPRNAFENIPFRELYPWNLPENAYLPSAYTFDSVSEATQWEKLFYDNYRSYPLLISDFLADTTRSKEYAMNEHKYAMAALCCLRILCGHFPIASTYTNNHLPIATNTLFNYKAPHHYVWSNILRRRNKPWAWRRAGSKHKLEFDDIHTLTRSIYSNWGDGYFARIKYVFCPLDKNQPIIEGREWLNYYAALFEYLPKFLALAARSEELIEYASRRIFDHRSRAFPKKARKARCAVNRYLRRMGAEVHIGDH